MVRVLTLVSVICGCALVFTPTEARRRVPKTTTTTPEPAISASHEEDVDSQNSGDDIERYHPAEVKHPRVLEKVDRKYKDGNFEYKYVLSNGVSRHEKSYWSPVGSRKVLARKGYYSHPLTNHKYLTVYYTADENGYHVDSSTYSNKVPVLPRNLVVPEYEFPTVSSTTSTTDRPKTRRTTSKSSTTTKHF